MTDRRIARRLAKRAVSEGQPLRWFEQLYAAARDGEVAVPWANLEVNPHLKSWKLLDPTLMRRTLVVGCGYGDDAEWLADRGCEVTGFDISEAAVEHCRVRFPAGRVRYVVANLLDPPTEWLDSPFDLVVEAYTIQALPPASGERRAAMKMLPNLTKGTLLVIARGREDNEDEGVMPWPLRRSEFDPLYLHGMQEDLFEDYLDLEDPPIRRFRATFSQRS